MRSAYVPSTNLHNVLALPMWPLKNAHISKCFKTRLSTFWGCASALLVPRPAPGYYCVVWPRCSGEWGHPTSPLASSELCLEADLSPQSLRSPKQGHTQAPQGGSDSQDVRPLRSGEELRVLFLGALGRCKNKEIPNVTGVTHITKTICHP